LWDALRFGRHERRRFADGAAFELLLRRYRVTGATMAFRTRFKDLVLPMPYQWIHDAWVALLISAVASGLPIGEVLLKYRQHTGQQIGEKKRGLYAQYRVARTISQSSYRAVAERYAQARERLQSLPGVAADRIDRLAAKIEHFQRRTRMRDPGAWRLPAILGEAWQGNYAHYSYGWKSIAQDLFL